MSGWPSSFQAVEELGLKVFCFECGGEEEVCTMVPMWESGDSLKESVLSSMWCLRMEFRSSSLFGSKRLYP